MRTFVAVSLAGSEGREAAASLVRGASLVCGVWFARDAGAVASAQPASTRTAMAAARPPGLRVLAVLGFVMGMSVAPERGERFA